MRLRSNESFEARDSLEAMILSKSKSSRMRSRDRLAAHDLLSVQVQGQQKTYPGDVSWVDNLILQTELAGLGNGRDSTMSHRS